MQVNNFGNKSTEDNRTGVKCLLLLLHRDFQHILQHASKSVDANKNGNLVRNTADGRRLEPFW